MVAVYSILRLLPSSVLAHMRGQRPGIAHIAIGAHQRQFHAMCHRLARPYLAVKAGGAAVQGVRIVVQRDMERPARQG